jgi:hypothetical protein
MSKKKSPSRKKKGSPSRKKSPSKKKIVQLDPIPGNLGFPERESDNMLHVISKAFSLVSLVTLQNAEMEGGRENAFG